MKKILKVILYISPFLIAVFLIYFMYSGKSEKLIIKILDKTHKATSNDKEDDENKINLVYKDGKVDLNKSFKFYIQPTEEYYDTNNKSVSNYAYGMTQNENDFKNEYIKLVNENDNIKTLEENQRGGLRFNKETVVKVSEEFDIKSQHLKGIVTGVTVKNDIDDEELNNLLNKYKKIETYLDEKKKIKQMTIIKKKWDKNGELLEEKKNMDVSYVVVDITYESYSEWIQQTDLCPKLIYLNEFENRLEKMGMDEEAGYYSESELISLGMNDYVMFSPVFNDVNANANKVNTNYPMMKGEEYKVKVGYIIPNEYLDKCYLWYNYFTVYNNYRAIDDVLIKLK